MRCQESANAEAAPTFDESSSVRNRCMRKQRTTRPRTRSVRGARSAVVIGRPGNSSRQFLAANNPARRQPLERVLIAGLAQIIERPKAARPTVRRWAEGLLSAGFQAARALRGPGVGFPRASPWRCGTGGPVQAQSTRFRLRRQDLKLAVSTRGGAKSGPLRSPGFPAGPRCSARARARPTPRTRGPCCW